MACIDFNDRKEDKLASWAKTNELAHTYDKDWHQNLVDCISVRLAKINGPIDLLFAIFTYG